MDNGIFGLATYLALRKTETKYIETKKGRTTLEELVKFYEALPEEPPEVKSVLKRDNVKTRKHTNKGEIK